VIDQPHRLIAVRRGPNGCIEHHIENDGYGFLRRGAEARDEWSDLRRVKACWPHLVAEVEVALAEPGAL
jgi:hypothetical protein